MAEGVDDQILPRDGETSKKSFLGSREFFAQEPLPLSREKIVRQTNLFLSEVTIDNYQDVVGRFNEWLKGMYQELNPEDQEDQNGHFAKIVPEGPPSETHSERRERRLQIWDHYHHEIRKGVRAMIDLEDAFVDQPDLTADELVDAFFDCDNEEMVPRVDLTNEQSFLILAAGLSYLVDHKILEKAKAEYGDDVVRVAKELYKLELEHPEKAEVLWQKDVGVALVVDSEDMGLFSRTNPLGVYLIDSALNGQLMIIEREPEEGSPQSWRERIVRHERDHLFFYKYRTIGDQFKKQPDIQEARERLSDDPFAAELIIGLKQMRKIKASIATEVSAYSLERRPCKANVSVKLHEMLPINYLESRLANKEETPPLAPYFFQKLADRYEIPRRAIYPIIREEVYIRFFHAMDLCRQAIDHGVPGREVSAALAILGPDRVRHLRALDPRLKLTEYDTDISLFGNSPRMPYFYEYARRYDIDYQGEQSLNFRFMRKIKREASLFLSKLELRRFLLQKENLESRFSLSRQERKNRYIMDPPLSVEIEFSTFKSRVISAARAVFPNLSQQFFTDAYEAETPFHPIYDPEKRCADFSARIARMVKEVAVGSDRWVNKRTDQLLTLSKKDEGDYYFEKGFFWEERYFPLLWAVINYPQDAELLTRVANELLPATVESSPKKSFTARDGNVIAGDGDWRTHYLGFFYDYRLIRQDEKLDEQEKRKAIGELVGRWETFLGE